MSLHSTLAKGGRGNFDVGGHHRRGRVLADGADLGTEVSFDPCVREGAEERPTPDPAAEWSPSRSGSMTRDGGGVEMLTCLQILSGSRETGCGRSSLHLFFQRRIRNDQRSGFELAVGLFSREEEAE